MRKKGEICWAVTFPVMLRDVFVQACGCALVPGVGFMVMGSGCLCRRLVVVRGWIGSHWQGDFTTGNGTDLLKLTA